MEAALYLGSSVPRGMSVYGVTGAGRAVSYEHAPLACACFPHTLSGSHVWGKEVRANAMGCVLALHPTFSHTFVPYFRTILWAGLVRRSSRRAGMSLFSPPLLLPLLLLSLSLSLTPPLPHPASPSLSHSSSLSVAGSLVALRSPLLTHTCTHTSLPPPLPPSLPLPFVQIDNAVEFWAPWLLPKGVVVLFLFRCPFLKF